MSATSNERKSPSPASRSSPVLPGIHGTTPEINAQLEQMVDVHSAYQKYVEVKKLEPSNATQLTKFCSQNGIANVKYSQASKYFRIKYVCLLYTCNYNASFKTFFRLTF